MPSRVLVSFSCGPDSVYLVHALLETHRADQLFLVYFDHGLRPDAVCEERDFFVLFLDRYGLEGRIRRLPVLFYAGFHGVSVEMAGRQLRYRFLMHLSAFYCCDAIATGHHSDDLVETFFLKLCRGTRGGVSFQRHVRFLKPLASIRKGGILQFLETRGLPYCVDASNKDPAFLRNIIRQDVMPALVRVNERVCEHVLSYLDYQTDVDAALMSVVANRFDSVVFEEGRVACPLSVFSGLSVFFQQFLCRMIFNRLREIQCSLRLEDCRYKGDFSFGSVHIELFLGLISKEKGKRIDLPCFWVGRRCSSVLKMELLN